MKSLRPIDEIRLDLAPFWAKLDTLHSYSPEWLKVKRCQPLIRLEHELGAAHRVEQRREWAEAPFRRVLRREGRHYIALECGHRKETHHNPKRTRCHYCADQGRDK